MPVVFAARVRGIPVIVHESDLTPGLANRLAIPFARAVCASFPETMAASAHGQGRADRRAHPRRTVPGDRAKGEAFLGLPADRGAAAWKPLLLVVGGSLGSRNLNKGVRAVLPDLLARYRVAHLCGKGGLDPSLEGQRRIPAVRIRGRRKCRTCWPRRT